MADTTDVLSLPFPEGSDANNVPSDMAALAERLDEVPGVESLTSAGIAALSAGEKPAGRVVYNSTTGKLQISNGSTFSDVDAAALAVANAALPKAGGTMTGRPILDMSSGYSQIVLKNSSAAYWISTDPGASNALSIAILNKDTLAYVSTPLAITTAGHVSSASHVGGTKTGTTDGNGAVTLTLPESPTGNWAVTVTGTSIDGSGGTGYGQLFYVTATSSTSATVRVARSSTGAYVTSTSVTFLYTAVAY